MKPSSLVFMRKLKNITSNITTTTSSTTTETDTYPRGIINTYTPYFSWPSVSDAVRYLQWVNDYGIPNIGGKINNFYIPNEANCPLSNGQYCKVYPNVQFSTQGGQWWVTAFFGDGRTNHTAVNGLLFSIQ